MVWPPGIQPPVALCFRPVRRFVVSSQWSGNSRQSLLLLQGSLVAWGFRIVKDQVAFFPHFNYTIIMPGFQ